MRIVFFFILCKQGMKAPGLLATTKMVNGERRKFIKMTYVIPQ